MTHWGYVIEQIVQGPSAGPRRASTVVVLRTLDRLPEGLRHRVGEEVTLVHVESTRGEPGADVVAVTL